MILRRITKHFSDQNWFAVVIEFVIIFVGVFIGLQAQEWYEETQDRERLNRIILALKADMTDARKVEVLFWNEVEQGLANFDEALTKGEHPTPYVFRIKGSDTAPKLIWGALQDAGIADLLDPELLFELAHFYSERNGIGVKVTRYMESIESNILPYLNQDVSYFYDESGKKLKPEFQASIMRLREWTNYIKDLGPWSECLEQRLGTASEPGQSCRIDWYTDFSEIH